MLDLFSSSGGFSFGLSSVYCLSKKMGCLRLTYQAESEQNFFQGLWKKDVGSKNCDNYYPFGLTFNSYNRENSIANDYKYNGKELQTELSLGVYDYGWRSYDPAIGRWWQIDPLAETMPDQSPYSYVFNNPIKYLDPFGMYPESGGPSDYDPLKEDKGNWEERYRESKNNWNHNYIATCPTCPQGQEYDQYRNTDQKFAYEEGVGVYNDVDITVTASRLDGNGDAGANRIAVAEKYLGKYTYKQGRAGDGAFLDDKHMDCSEFVLTVLKESDPEIYKKLVTTEKSGYLNQSTAIMQAQIKANGGTFRQTKPQVGDLIMWGGHVELVRTANGEYFTTIGAGGGTGAVVPRVMGMDRKTGKYNWLHTGHADIGTLGIGGYLGIWTPK